MTGSAVDIFLSYKAEDRARLEPLVAALEEAGFSLWWDARIGGGANWRQEIERHLDSAKCVVVAWSKRSVGPHGHFVRDEAARALRRGTYLPISLDGAEPPLGFGEVQAVAMKGWKGSRSDPRLAALVNVVTARIAGEDPGPAWHAEPPLGFGEVQAIALKGWKGSRSDPRLADVLAAAGARIAGEDPGPAWHAEPPRLSRRAVAIGAVGLGAVAAAGGWLLLKPEAANARRIAVLPFANLSNDPEQAYFSDGIAEELRSALSRIGMEVIGRASSAAVKDLDSKAAAARLDVANILTGSVRRSPGLIRITAQLVDGTDGVERWAQTYDRAPGDAIRIQADIAASVAQALSIALGQAGRAALALGGTADSLAQDLVLRGRERWVTADSLAKHEQALRFTDAAIARDGNYADAFVQRSMILTSIAENDPSDSAAVARLMAQAEAAAKRAARIAPRLGAAHVALARIAYNRLDIPAILAQTQKALALSPDDPEVLLDAATTMATFGRGAEGLRIAERLIALDGLNARAYARLSLVNFLLRRYPAVIAAVAKANSIAPGNPARNAIAGDSWLLLGQPDKARAEYAKMPADDYLRLTGEALTAAKTGDRPGAERSLALLREHYGASVSYQYAVIHAQLGDLDRSFAEFDKALALKDPGLVGLKTDPFLDPIRDDPRYRALLGKLNFPA